MAIRDSTEFGDVSRRRSPRFFLDAPKVAMDDLIIDSHFACWGELYGTHVVSKRCAGGYVEL